MSERDENRLAAEARAWYAAFFARRVGARGHDEVDDLAQEATIGLLRALRAGPVQNAEALRGAIGTRAWFGFLRRKYRWKKVWDETEVDDTTTAAAASSQPESHLDVGDPVERLRFQVLEFYRAHNARCLGLAEQFFSGLDWIEVANRAGLGYAAVRQQWSRCLKLLRDAAVRDEDLADSLWSFWQADDA